MRHDFRVHVSAKFCSDRVPTQLNVMTDRVERAAGKPVKDIGPIDFFSMFFTREVALYP